MSSDSEKSTFTEFTSAEREQKLRYLSSEASVVKIWKKGDPNKIDFSVVSFHNNKLSLRLMKSKDVKKILDSKVLFNSKYKSMDLFGSGDFREFRDDSFLLDVDSRMFKCEKRKNFRLLTFPVHEVTVRFGIDMQEVKESNLVDINSKKHGDITGLFRNFLELVDGEPTGIIRHDGEKSSVTFRVLDLSVSGMSFRISEFEKDFFDNITTLDEFTFVFNGKTYSIPGGQVVYIAPYPYTEKSATKHHKVGLNFFKLDDETYNELTRQLNKEYGEIDFEEFEKHL